MAQQGEAGAEWSKGRHSLKGVKLSPLCMSATLKVPECLLPSERMTLQSAVTNVYFCLPPQWIPLELSDAFLSAPKTGYRRPTLGLQKSKSPLINMGNHGRIEQLSK